MNAFKLSCSSAVLAVLVLTCAPASADKQIKPAVDNAVRKGDPELKAIQMRLRSAAESVAADQQMGPCGRKYVFCPTDSLKMRILEGSGNPKVQLYVFRGEGLDAGPAGKIRVTIGCETDSNGDRRCGIIFTKD